MFVVKKVVSAFLLPPGIFVLMLAAAGSMLLVRKRRIGGLFNLAAALLLWAVAATPVADRLMTPLEARYATLGPPAGDVIVLLGGGIVEGVPDFSGRGAPTGDMLFRIVTAARLQRQLQIPIIVSGGKTYSNMSAEADLAKRFLTDLGVDAAKVIIEARSRDTFDNARFTKEICDRMGFRRLILLTSAYHLRRAVYLFEKPGLTVSPYPSNFVTAVDRRYGWQDLLPSAGNLETTSAALHEYLGLLYYRLASAL